MRQRAARKTCVDCAYLAQQPTLAPPDAGEGFWRQHHEVPFGFRQSLRIANDEEYPVVVNGYHCYRGVWSWNAWALERVDLSDEGGRALVRQEIQRPRRCGAFYPYGAGTPSEHLEQHRSRTNRRWLTVGALLGPFVAATAAILATTEADPAKGVGYGDVGPFLVAGGVLLGFAWLVNVVLHRR